MVAWGVMETLEAVAAKEIPITLIGVALLPVMVIALSTADVDLRLVVEVVVGHQEIGLLESEVKTPKGVGPKEAVQVILMENLKTSG